MKMFESSLEQTFSFVRKIFKNLQVLLSQQSIISFDIIIILVHDVINHLMSCFPDGTLYYVTLVE